MIGENLTRTPETERDFLKRADSLARTAAVELGLTCEYTPFDKVVEWFHGSDFRWKPSTIRVYRAAIRCALESCCQNPDAHDEASAALARLNAEPARPMPIKGARPRTSARKRKSASIVEIREISDVLLQSQHRYAALARHMLWLNTELGLRPIEWSTARLEGTTLVVTNAKATNARANGEVRHLDLSDLKPSLATMVKELLAMIEAALETSAWVEIAAGIRHLFSWASAKAAKAVPSLRGAKISPYTTRHIAAARAKVAMDEASVAALLGHNSTRTAQSHYARPRTARGWALTRVGVDPSHVKTVRRTYRARGAKLTSTSPEPLKI